MNKKLVMGLIVVTFTAVNVEAKTKSAITEQRTSLTSTTTVKFSQSELDRLVKAQASDKKLYKSLKKDTKRARSFKAKMENRAIRISDLKKAKPRFSTNPVKPRIRRK